MVESPIIVVGTWNKILAKTCKNVRFTKRKRTDNELNHGQQKETTYHYCGYTVWCGSV